MCCRQRAVIELTRRYEETVKKNRLEKWTPKNFDFEEFMKGLASIQTVSLQPVVTPPLDS